MRNFALAAALGVALAACVEDSKEEDPIPPGPRTISARLWTDHWVDDGTVTQVFGAPPGTAVSALVPDASPDGYEEFPGTVGTDGTVTIPDVPSGDYLLRIDRPYTRYRDEPTCDPSCVVAEERTDTVVVQFTTSTPPLGALVAHRHDLARTADPTPVQLSLTNVDPDTALASQIWVESSQADLDLWLARPDVGATEYAGEVDWARGYVPFAPPDAVGLPSAASGDVVNVLQRAYRVLPATWASSGVLLRLTTRAAALDDVTIVGGAGGSISAALATVPLSESISLQLGATAFQALGPSLAPPGAATDLSWLSAGVYAAPHSVAYPAPGRATVGGFPFAPSPWMRLFYLDATGPFSADADLGTIAYGGFLAAPWAGSEFLRISYGPEVRHLVPGTGQSVLVYPSVYSDLPRSAVPAGKIGPALGPPRSPRIASRDAWLAQAAVGATPLLSWTAPALGTPSAYDVAVIPVDPADRGVSARVYGVQSFRVPPGILVAGHHYYAMVSAIAGPAFERDTNPFKAGLPRHQADCVTALFSP